MMRHSERGNVLFYIFLAVALFGALSFAVSQSGRESGQTAATEKDRLRATEIIDYGDSVAKSVGILRLRGTTLATLRFSDPALSAVNYGAPNPANATNEVFNIEGGGINYRPAGSDTVTTSTAEDYQFLSGNAVKGIGATCAAATCSDLMIVLANVKTTICLEINTLAGIPNPSGAPPIDSQLDTTHFFQGAMTYSQTIGDEATSIGLAGQLYGCFLNNNDLKNYFYRVLWLQ